MIRVLLVLFVKNIIIIECIYDPGEPTFAPLNWTQINPKLAENPSKFVKSVNQWILMINYDTLIQLTNNIIIMGSFYGPKNWAWNTS